MITLMTDFGYKDPYVGIMKGVIYGLNPDVQIVDITHGISAHNIMEAAIKINESYRYFPGHTIHMVVVDPGVGSERRPIMVQVEGHTFVGPDNGVFAKVIASATEQAIVRHITAEHHFLPERGNTFHGRDVFAPVAAWLSKGVKGEDMGEEIEDAVTLDFPLPSPGKGGSLNGRVVYIDAFGNAITNLTPEHIKAVLDKDPDKKLRVLTRAGQMDFKNFFAESTDGKPHAIINSNGHLEIFIYRGNASEVLKLNPGDPVGITLA